ncbi:MAG: glycoside hydrolase family 172 protein, partial [Flavitalea sp.]
MRSFQTIARLSFVTSLFLFNQQTSAQVIDMTSELNRLYNVAALPVANPNTTVDQISSYDRKGGNNDGFEGTYSFVRKTENNDLVIFEAAGKGVIERIWTPTPTDDTLDFYFDGSKTPSYSIKFNDLYNGKVYPFVNPVAGKKVGGWYSYLPIPYADGCTVVLRAKKMLFYQVQYRTYTAPDVTVKTFSPELSSDAAAILDKIRSDWSAEKYAAGPTNLLRSVTLNPGSTAVLAEIKTGGRIKSIKLGSAKAFEGLGNNLDIRITWDGEQTPAVFAPVEDFFGYAFGSVSMRSFLVGVEDDLAYCNIPMPFEKSAKIELVYRKSAAAQKPLKITSAIEVTQTAKGENEGKFYALWKREIPPLGKPYVFIEGEGSGSYIGTLLWSQARTYEYFTEFFEGDDSTVLDNKHLIHGTGSEDYFNGGWYAQPNGWVERKGAPLHGCLDYSLPLSRTGGYRFYILDKLPFQQKIYHSMEHGPEKNNRVVEYTSVAMYYANKPIAKGKAPDNKSSKIFIPDTLSFYTRLMDHISYSGEAKLQHGNFELGANKSGGININVSELTPGRYTMYLYGQFTLGAYSKIEGSAQRKLINKDVKDDEEKVYNLGSFEISDVSKPVKVEFQAG